MEISGSCLCNAVRFKVDSAPKVVVNCHCNFCRKHSGAAFSTYAAVPEAALEIIAGQDSISAFEVKENAHKHFCRQCGSPIFNKNVRYAGLCMIYLGTIADPQNLVPAANIYCESQLPWVSAVGEITSFEQGIARQARQTA